MTSFTWSAPLHSPAGVNQSKRSLLLVDDSLTTLAVAKSFLESRSFKVFALSEPARTVELASSIRPELILLDYELPGANGDELCAELKRQEAADDFLEHRLKADRFFHTGTAEQWRNGGLPDALVERVERDHGAVMRQWGYLED